jgi:outer membrane protein TolC
LIGAVCPSEIQNLVIKMLVFTSAINQCSRSLGTCAAAALMLVVALHASPPAVDGSLPEDSMPELKNILTAALKQSPQMILREIDLSQADASRYLANSIRWPSLGGAVSYASEQSAVSSNTDSKSKSSGLYYSLSLSQSFFQWGALKNQSEIAKIGVLAAEKNYAEAYRVLVGSLRSQYLAHVVKKATLEALRFRLKLGEQALAVEEEKLQNGMISVGDLIGPRQNLEESRLSADRLQEDYNYTKQLFAHLAGFEEIAEELIANQISKPSFSPEKTNSLMTYLRQDNAQSTFQLEIYALNGRQADLNYKIARVRLLPKFYFGASTSLQNQNSANVSAGTVSQAGITTQAVNINAQWTLFDGFATRGAKRSALATKRFYDRLAKTLIQTILDQAETQQRQLGFSARALDLVETRFNLAIGGKDRAFEEFQLGNIPQTAVDESIASYNSANVALMTTRAEFLVRWSDFVSLVGADPALTLLPPRYVR